MKSDLVESSKKTYYSSLLINSKLFEANLKVVYWWPFTFLKIFPSWRVVLTKTKTIERVAMGLLLDKRRFMKKICESNPLQNNRIFDSVSINEKNSKCSKCSWGGRPHAYQNKYVTELNRLSIDNQAMVKTFVRFCFLNCVQHENSVNKKKSKIHGTNVTRQVCWLNQDD